MRVDGGSGRSDVDVATINYAGADPGFQDRKKGGGGGGGRGR